MAAGALAFAASVGDDPAKPKAYCMLAFVNHWELIVLVVIVLLLFGNRIPGMMRSLGSGITEFKKGLKGDDKANGNPPARSGDGS